MNKILVLNHKTYMNYGDVDNYIKKIKSAIRKDVNLIICPSDIYIPYFKGEYGFRLGAQNLSGINVTGNSTGEQLKSLDVEYAIIGHSERKINFFEDGKIINSNIKSAIKNNIIPIVCVGETKEEFDRRKTADVIIRQLKEYFNDINVEDNIMIAYEPCWAIGTGVVASNEHIFEVVDFIKTVMFKKYNVDIKVLYGGSVDLSVIDKLNKLCIVDGFLVGKISVNVDKILQLIKKI